MDHVARIPGNPWNQESLRGRGEVLRPKVFSSLGRSLKEHLYRTHSLTVFRAPDQLLMGGAFGTGAAFGQHTPTVTGGSILYGSLWRLAPPK